MATSTKLIVVNNSTPPPPPPEEDVCGKRFIFYQYPQQPEIDTDVFVWRKLNIPSGEGQGHITVPFDVQCTASVSNSSGSSVTSKPYSPENGDQVSVKKGPCDKPILKTTSTGFKIYTQRHRHSCCMLSSMVQLVHMTSPLGGKQVFCLLAIRGNQLHGP